MPPRDMLAAGAVVTRKGGDVLLVHRPKYDDWSFPKGKLDRGEHTVAAAVREVAEETGLDVRLGPPLEAQRYPLARGRMKRVDYWVARVIGKDDVSRYRANAEIDRVEWVPWDRARARLTYPRDQVTLDSARPLRRRTRAVVVVRHGLARSRSRWKHDDRLRPLLVGGGAQAERLIPLLAAFDVTEVHTSPNVRCLDTVRPYADTTGWPLETHTILSEQDATTRGVVALVDELVESPAGLAICTHRPVLPTVIDALRVPDHVVEDGLDKGEMLVVHLRKGRVVATERHHP